MQIYRYTITTPIGDLVISASVAGLTGIDIADSPPATAQTPASNEVLSLAVTQLKEYFDCTRRSFDVPLDPPPQPTFFAQVHHYLATIPFGETRSYQHIATDLGHPAAVRAVGAACRSNPLLIVVPCHRVIRSDGHLGGFRAGTATKAWLLDHEQTPPPIR